jgi:ribosomal protein S18 acetylase RimI-like enzyme
VGRGLPRRLGAPPGAHRPGGRPLTETLATLAGPGVVLRRATEADLPDLVRLLADDPLGRDREAADPAPYRRAFALIDADPAHLLVVAVDGPDVVGTMQLSFIPGLSRQGALRAQVEAVRVAAGHRGRGLGAAMLGWAIAEARRRGCALVQLTTDKSRDDAHRFYERLGFVASHEGMKLVL